MVSVQELRVEFQFKRKGVWVWYSTPPRAIWTINNQVSLQVKEQDLAVAIVLLVMKRSTVQSNARIQTVFQNQISFS